MLLEVIGSSPNPAELGVRGTFLESRTWAKIICALGNLTSTFALNVGGSGAWFVSGLSPDYYFFNPQVTKLG